MHISKLPDLRRREFLRRAVALGVFGTAAPLVATLTRFGIASAATAPTGYKALVCVFLYGGNDYGNTLVPYDPASYSAYSAIRQALATPRDQLAATVLTPSVALPNARSMALAPQLAPLKPIFDAGRLGVMLNLGNLVQPTTLAQYQARSVPLPPKLFSHPDQTNVWQEAAPENLNTGWGGRISDLLMSSNAYPTFTCVNVTQNAIFMAGQQVDQYQISSSGPTAINGLNRSIVMAPKPGMWRRKC